MIFCTWGGEGTGWGRRGSLVAHCASANCTIARTFIVGLQFPAFLAFTFMLSSCYLVFDTFGCHFASSVQVNLNRPPD